MHYEGAREPHSLAHAAGELARIGRLEAVEADEVDGGERAAADLGGRHSQRFKPDLHVFKHREPREKRKALEHHGDAGRRPRHALAEIVDAAARGTRKACDHAQQRRLARARTAEQTHDLARAQRQVDAVENQEFIAIGLVKSLPHVLHVKKQRRIHWQNLIALGHSEAALGLRIERTPEEPVEQHDE